MPDRATKNKPPPNHSPSFPRPATPAEGGYAHHAERVEGRVIRARSDSFKDHFSQARMFFASLTAVELGHLTDALCFELGKVERMPVHERVVTNIDCDLAAHVARAVGVSPPAAPAASPALSMVANAAADTIRSRRVAILVAEGFTGASLRVLKAALEQQGATVDVVSTALGQVRSSDQADVKAVRSLLTAASVMYDAVAIADGSASLATSDDAVRFVHEAYQHCKALAAIGTGAEVLAAAKATADEGVVVGKPGEAIAKRFIAAIAQHRHWGRERVRSQTPPPARR